MATQYLNTDLEIESLEDLTPIVEEFPADVSCLFHGRIRDRNRACFELAGPSDANECIRMFHALVKGLSPKARSVWDGCSRRTLDVGFEAGHDRENCQQVLTHEVLALAASIRAHLVITVYPPSNHAA